jgi:putative DNA primase/helicase
MVKLGQLMIGKGLYSTVPLSSIGQRFRDLPLLYSVVNIDSELGSSIPTSSEAALKQVVSGDPRDFERKYGETVTGIVRAKFVFIGNELISVKDRSDGFWRRLQLFHFSRTIPEDKRIPDLEKIIFSEESSGVLNLLLDGIKRLYEQKGLTIDPESQSLFTEYKEQANPDYGFINTFLSLEKDSKVCLGDLYKSYSTFVASHSLTPSNLQHFRSALLGAFPIPKISFSKIRCEGKENPVACVLGLKFDIKRFNDEVGQESQTFVPSIFPGVPS